MNSKISDKDKKDWIDFLSNNETLTDKDENFKKQKIKKSFSFDLHGYSLDEANKKIKSIVWDAYENGISKLIIVTGKAFTLQMKKIHTNLKI